MEICPEQRVAVIGGGIEGTAAVEFLRSLGCQDITILDKNEDLSFDQSVRHILGPNYLKGLDFYHVIFRSPGCPRDLPEILKAEAKGSIITSCTKEFFDRCNSSIVGITGSNGKTTTTSLISEVLKTTFGNNVHTGGNDRFPLINLLANIHRDHVAVLEMSSFQLEDLGKSPSVSIVLNFTPNHLDYHKDMDSYYLTKSNIVRFQKNTDYCVLNHAFKKVKDLSLITKSKAHFFNLDTAETCAFQREGRVIIRWDSKEETLCRESDLKIKTNLDNVMAAALVGKLFGIPTQSIAGAVCGFKGVKQRLELIRELNGVRYYNDSSSTTPESSINALLSFAEGKVILLAGGSDKGVSFDSLGKEIVRSQAKVMLYGATRDMIREAIDKAEQQYRVKVHVELCSDMEEAVKKASQIAVPSDNVVLSPACASFDMFTNSKERGRIFDKIVENL